MGILTLMQHWAIALHYLVIPTYQQVIKLGIVYDPLGPFSNAYLGYTFYAHKINNAGGLIVGKTGNQTAYKVEIVAHSTSNQSDPYWISSGSHITYDKILMGWIYNDNRSRFPVEQDRHYIQQQRLWKYDKVDFELGGTTNVAANETMTSAQHALINMVCCVGPDSIYEQDFPTETVFGMQCTNEKYTQETILTLALKGARTIAITYSNSVFTKSTCVAAKYYALEQAATPFKLVYEYMYAQSWETTVDFTANPVYDVATNASYDLNKAFKAMAATKPDVWIHCGNMKSGVYGLKLLNTLGFRPKATLQTVAPNSIEIFMTHLGSLGNHVLGVGQWHPAMTYKDSFFGSASTYSADFKAYTGADPEYVGAGAAASAYVLGVFDTDKIVANLKKMRMQTFFGDLEFNAFRRNVAKVPATLQNIPDSTQKYGINQACVLPVAFGNAELVYPDPLSQDNSSSTSLSAYIIIAIAISSAFVVLLAVVIFLVHRHFNVDQKAIRIARSKNCPIHVAILKQAAPEELLRVIDENRDKTIQLHDQDGKTALDIALEEDIFAGDNITTDVVFRLFRDLFDELYSKSEEDSLSPEALENPRIHCWAHLAQLSSDKALEIVEMILNYSPRRCKEFSKLFDEHGRQVVDIASPKCKLAIQRRLWLHRRYEIREGRPEHVSATAVVVLAVDHKGDGDALGMMDGSCSPELNRSSSGRRYSLHGTQKAQKMVALKFMRSYEQFSVEIRSRAALAIQRDHVVGILTHYGSGNRSPLDTKKGHGEDAFRQDAITKGFQAYPFCLVMEAGDDTLKRIIDDQHIAGCEWDEIKSITKQVTLALKHVHSYGFIHGDIKPSNIIQVGTKIKLIDLDAAANFAKGEMAGAKFSSGYVPPELLYLDSDGHPNVRSFTILPYTSERIHGSYELTPASPAIDMWALGVILFLMCTGSSLFQCAVDDNIFKREDLLALHSWSFAESVPILAKVSNRYARNLISMLLNKDPLRRPSPARILDHPFLSNKRSVRFPGEEAIYDVFLSYRVASDSMIAQLIYERLTNMGVRVWFDKMNILPGRDWEQEFADGLLTSSCFVCLLSRNAINHPTKIVQNFNALNASSKADSVLMEWTLALEFAERGLLTKIYPVMIGDRVNEETEGEPIISYTNYFSSGCHPSSCQDVVVQAVELRAKAHLERQGLGHPYRDTASVQQSVADIVSRQGSFIEGDLDISVKKLVGDIATMIQRPALSATSTNSGRNSPHIKMRKKLGQKVDVIPPQHILQYSQSSCSIIADSEGERETEDSDISMVQIVPMLDQLILPDDF